MRECNDWYLFVHDHYTVQGSNQHVWLNRELNIAANMSSAPKRLIPATCEEIKQWNRKDMSLFCLWLTVLRMPFLQNNHKSMFISTGFRNLLNGALLERIIPPPLFSHFCSRLHSSRLLIGLVMSYWSTARCLRRKERGLHHRAWPTFSFSVLCRTHNHPAPTIQFKV